MDFTNIKCISEQCKNAGIKMRGNGGSIQYANLKCPECELRLTVLIPKEGYEYSVNAQKID